MSPRIGFPRALAYYVYFPFWEAFLTSLGLEVVVSGMTTKGVLDKGVKETVNDACVPIKLFHGHVVDLQGKADYIFLPRLVNVTREKHVTFCPKFLGLPDMVKASCPDLPPIIDERIDLKKGRLELFRVCRRIAERFDIGFWPTMKAYLKALKKHSLFNKLLLQEKTPLEAMNILNGKEPEKVPKGSLTFAVLGFPYAVYDRFVSVDIIKKLREMGVRVLTAEMIPPQVLARQAKNLPKNLFWTFSNQVMRAAYYYLDHHRVDGIIHVTAFGCGPDAMVDKFIELESKKRGKMPFMSVTIDEHTGEAGMATRLEAFVDMLRLRREAS